MSTYNRNGGKTIDILNILYPKRCPICDRALKIWGDKKICEKCKSKVEYVNQPYCYKCGKPIYDEQAEYCSDCSKKDTSFQYGRAVFIYNTYIKQSISKFKYGGRQEYAEFYAESMYEKYAEWILTIAPDAIIPIPIHKKRYRQRGYNQAELIAQKLGAICRVPVLSNYIQRVKDTIAQKELSVVERKSNLENAFAISDKSKELYQNINCVIIIDDIYTTGSTIEACSKVLKNEGVDNIYFLCVSIGKGF